jgi:hypothetical protein
MLIVIKDIPENNEVVKDVKPREFSFLKEVLEELAGWNPYNMASIKVNRLIETEEEFAEYVHEGNYYKEVGE